MRMTQRGFKDSEAEGLLTFSGTSSRISQRLIVSEAVIRDWPLAAIDVKKAFLKGITYKELAEMSGEPIRNVCFELNAETASILRTCPGYEDFDYRQEILHNLIPGTGTKDAPRCFGIKLDRATNDIFGAKATTHDPQLIVRHILQNNSDPVLDFIERSTLMASRWLVPKK